MAIGNSTATSIGSEFVANTTTLGTQNEHTVALLKNGRFVVLYNDWSGASGDTSLAAVRGQIFNRDGSKFNGEFVANTTTFNDQFDSSIAALSDGRFVVTYADWSRTGGDTSNSAVRAQIFNANGSKSGSEFLVNSTSNFSQYRPVVTELSNGQFVIAFEDHSGSHDDNSDTAVRAQVFNANGSKSGSEFLVNTITASDQFQPRITALDQGRFVAVYADYSGTVSPDSYSDIRAQIFNADGSKVGVEFLVNKTTKSNQLYPTVETLSNGRFVVAYSDWSETGGDTSNKAVRAQIFNADGSSFGSEILVNTRTRYHQFDPDITALPDGRFVITYTDTSQRGADSSNGAIRAQVFNANGSKLGSEFLVNTTVDQNQFDPTVTSLGGKRFVISYSDASQSTGDTSGEAIRAQIFKYDDTPPKVTVSDAQTREGGLLKFTVSMNETSAEDVVVKYKINLGTKAVFADRSDIKIDKLTGTVKIKAGQLSSKAFDSGIVMQAVADGKNERDFEYVGVKLVKVTNGNAVLAKDSVGKGQIIDTQVNRTKTAVSDAGDQTEHSKPTSKNPAWPDHGEKTLALSKMAVAAYGHKAEINWLEKRGWTFFTASTEDQFFRAKELWAMWTFEPDDNYVPNTGALTGPGSLDWVGQNLKEGLDNASAFKTTKQAYTWAGLSSPVIETKVPSIVSKRLDSTASVVIARKADTLVVSFTGTDEAADKLSWLQMGKHFSQFVPLLNRLVVMVEEDKKIEHVEFTGHSLGAAMAEAAYTFYKPVLQAAKPDIEVSGMNFASPGYSERGYINLLKGGAAVIASMATGGLSAAAVTALKKVGGAFFKATLKDFVNTALKDIDFETYQNDGDLIGLAALFQDNIGQQHTTSFSLQSTIPKASGNVALHSSKLYADVQAQVTKVLGESSLAKSKFHTHTADQLVTEYQNIMLHIDYNADDPANWIIDSPNTAGKFVGFEGKSSKSNLILGTDKADFIAGTSLNLTPSYKDDNHAKLKKDDFVFGRDGADRIWTSGGNDYIDGGAKSDTIYAGADNDVVFGGGGVDTIEGGGGSDTIHGGANGDTIIGGAGGDVLYGDSGADTFLFQSHKDLAVKRFDTDRIFDFSLTQGDTLDLQDIDAKAWTGRNEAFNFIGASAFSGKRGELRVYKNGFNETVVSADRSGDGVSDFKIFLSGVHDLKVSDFFL